MYCICCVLRILSLWDCVPRRCPLLVAQLTPLASFIQNKYIIRDPVKSFAQPDPYGISRSPSDYCRLQLGLFRDGTGRDRTGQAVTGRGGTGRDVTGRGGAGRAACAAQWIQWKSLCSTMNSIEKLVQRSELNRKACAAQ